MNAAADFPEHLSSFFAQYLMQRDVSPHTVASYRDTFRLLVMYAHGVLGKPPQELCFNDLDTDFLAGFFEHLESRRGNGARTRNARLAAIRSLSRFIAMREPRHAALAQQILAMPCKRTVRRPVDYLDRDEAEALLQAPDQNTGIGRRDYTLLLVALQTGLRASELITLPCENVHNGTGAHLRCHGKGRKDRVVPLRRDSVAALRAWIEERRGGPDEPVFANQRGRPLTHDSLNYLLAKNLAVARMTCPSLRQKRVSPHSLRHTCAMTLLQSGVDQATIALWLGHESVATTYIYLHADLKLKEKAMAKTTPLGKLVQRYQPEDKVLKFLNGL